MGQTSFPPSILPRVSALVRLLGSPIDAEAISAARALGRTLTGAGYDFHDLADRIEHGPPTVTSAPEARPAPQATRTAATPANTVTWKAAQRRAVAERLRKGLHSRAFTSWEAKFAADVAEMIADGRRSFSPKQKATAEELAAKVARQGSYA